MHTKDSCWVYFFFAPHLGDLYSHGERRGGSPTPFSLLPVVWCAFTFDVSRTSRLLLPPPSSTRSEG